MNYGDSGMSGQDQPVLRLLPLFGVRHDRLKPEAVLPLLAGALREGAPGRLKSVLLKVPPGTEAEAEVGRLLSKGPEITALTPET